jgi:hypothetical protein
VDHLAADLEYLPDHRLGYQLFRLALGNDPPALHENEAVGIAGREVEVVEDQHDRAAVLGVSRIGFRGVGDKTPLALEVPPRRKSDGGRNPTARFAMMLRSSEPAH